MKKCAESGLRAASGPAAGTGAGRARRRGRGTARTSGRPDHPLAAPRPRGLPTAAARPPPRARRALPPPRGAGQRRDSERWELQQRGSGFRCDVLTARLPPALRAARRARYPGCPRLSDGAQGSGGTRFSDVPPRPGWAGSLHSAVVGLSGHCLILASLPVL